MRLDDRVGMTDQSYEGRPKITGLCYVGTCAPNQAQAGYRWLTWGCSYVQTIPATGLRQSVNNVRWVRLGLTGIWFSCLHLS